MPKEVIDAIMARRNPRTGRNYTRDEAERIYQARAGRLHALPKHSHSPDHFSKSELTKHLQEMHPHGD